MNGIFSARSLLQVDTALTAVEIQFYYILNPMEFLHHYMILEIHILYFHYIKPHLQIYKIFFSSAFVT